MSSRSESVMFLISFAVMPSGGFLIYFYLSSSMNFGSIASLLSVVDDGSKSKSLFRNGFQLPPIISIIVSGKYETHIAKKLIMCYATYIAVRGV